MRGKVWFGSVDPSGVKFVRRYFERLSKAFSKALNNAQRKGYLLDSVAVREEADFFTASTLGLFVMIRAKASPVIIKNATKIAIDHLERLCV